jgi:rRNA-processing protein FCF1
VKDSSPQDLVAKYQRSGALIDTNLLLLYLVGKVDTGRIPTFKRTKQYVVEDFHLMERLVSSFQRIVTTPNILTEVSDLAGQLSGELRARFFQQFREQIEILDEQYWPSKEVSLNEYFTRCGLTDSVIMSVTPNQYLVITDDFRLSNILDHLGIDVINLNHIRTLVWSRH